MDDSLFSLLVFAAFVLGVLGAVAIASARDPNIRRKVTIISKSGTMDSFWVNRKNLKAKNGNWVYRYRGADYISAGPQYQFTYRLVRSFGMRKYIGLQRVYFEGNPTPVDLLDKERQIAILRDTGRILANATDTDLPTRLLRPRKVDLLLLVLIGMVAFFVGFAIGGRT